MLTSFWRSCTCQLIHLRKNPWDVSEYLWGLLLLFWSVRPLVCEDIQADVEDGQLQFFYVLAFVLRGDFFFPLKPLTIFRRGAPSLPDIFSVITQEICFHQFLFSFFFHSFRGPFARCWFVMGTVRFRDTRQVYRHAKFDSGWKPVANKPFPQSWREAEVMHVCMFYSLFEVWEKENFDSFLKREMKTNSNVFEQISLDVEAKSMKG